MMGTHISALTLATRLVMQLNGLIAALDIDIMGPKTSRLMQQTKQLSGDLRLDVRDWEMSENRQDMTRNASQAQQRAEELRAQVLRASEQGIFSAIAVVDISAQLDAITTQVA